MFQTRVTPKNIFAFTSRGPKLSTELLHLLSAKTYETCVDGHDLRYSLIRTFKPKRDKWIETTIDNWNKRHRSTFKFCPWPFEGNILSFTKAAGETANDHAMVKIIRDYQTRADSTYEQWECDRLNRELDIDMVGAGPTLPERRKRSAAEALAESSDSQSEASSVSAIVAPAEQPSLQDLAGLTDELKDLKRQVAVLTDIINANHQNSSGMLQSIDAKTTEQTSLRQDLEATRRERDEERLAKRTQAGKMSVVTRKLNETLARNAEIEAAQQRSVERADVIRAIEQGTALVHASVNALTPLGNPSDEQPYTNGMIKRVGLYRHYMAFRANLDENCSNALLVNTRKDLPMAPPFTESAKVRLFMHGLGVVLDNPKNAVNLDNSSAMHRFDLTFLSGPIFSEDTFNKIRDSMERIVKYLLDKAGLAYIEDDAVYPTIAGDAFLVPEMATWRLEEGERGTAFHDYFRKAVKRFGFSERAHWRYFTFMHMVGAKKHNTELTHRELLALFEGGAFYSKATVQGMESKYLERMARIRRPDEFNDAAVTVGYRASQPRQSSQSTRPNKIKNH